MALRGVYKITGIVDNPVDKVFRFRFRYVCKINNFDSLGRTFSSQMRRDRRIF